jgi:hypothetical protein
MSDAARPRGLCNRCLKVRPTHLVKVDDISAQPSRRILDLLSDAGRTRVAIDSAVFPGQSDLWWRSSPCGATNLRAPCRRAPRSGRSRRPEQVSISVTPRDRWRNEWWRWTEPRQCRHHIQPPIAQVPRPMREVIRPGFNSICSTTDSCYQRPKPEVPRPKLR